MTDDWPRYLGVGLTWLSIASLAAVLLVGHPGVWRWLPRLLRRWKKRWDDGSDHWPGG